MKKEIINKNNEIKKKLLEKQIKTTRSLLNRITPDNFEKIVLRIKIENNWSTELLEE